MRASEFQWKIAFLIAGLLWFVAMIPTAQDPPRAIASWAHRAGKSATPAATVDHALVEHPFQTPRIQSIIAPTLVEAEAVAYDDSSTAASSDKFEWFVEDQGPVGERKRAYESESRDSAAFEVESRLRAAFSQPDCAPDLFRSVLCRQSICKIELRWSQARLEGYVAGISRALSYLQAEIAASPAGPPFQDGTRPVELYLKRWPVERRD